MKEVFLNQSLLTVFNVGVLLRLSMLFLIRDTAQKTIENIILGKKEKARFVIVVYWNFTMTKNASGKLLRI
jgi:hypothetical protein